jgi:hypothetical protein
MQSAGWNLGRRRSPEPPTEVKRQGQGQSHRFDAFALNKIACAIERHAKEMAWSHGVLNKHLLDRGLVAGEDSVADMTACPAWAAEP